MCIKQGYHATTIDTELRESACSESLKEASQMIVTAEEHRQHQIVPTITARECHQTLEYPRNGNTVIIQHLKGTCTAQSAYDLELDSF